MSYSDIIDNRRSFLKDEINSVPEATEKDKFAVGYLFLSGFNEVVIYKISKIPDSVWKIILEPLC